TANRVCWLARSVSPWALRNGAAPHGADNRAPALAQATPHLYAAPASAPRGPWVACAMNRFERLLGLKGEARLRFLDGEFQVLAPGEFVRCAVTGQSILLPDLRYWRGERREASANAESAFERSSPVRGRKK